MRRRNRQMLYVLSGFVDALIIVGSFMASSWVRNGTVTGISVPFYENWSAYGLYIVCAYAFVLVAVYATMRVYGDVFCGRVRRMATSIFIANTVGVFVFSSLLFLFRLVEFSRLTLLYFYVSSTALVILKQLVIIHGLFWRRSRKDLRVPVLVAGSRDLAWNYANTIGNDDTRYERIIGHVAPQPAAQADGLLRDYLGDMGQLDAILTDRRVDEVIIALEADEYPLVQSVMSTADKHGIPVRLVPFYNDLIPRNPAVESIHGLTVVDVRTTALDNLPAAVLKRFFDIVMSAFILVLISPVMLVTAVGVKLSSPGPVFFKQERIGRHRRPFYMLKFRSMRMTDDPVSTFTEDKDARKTRFGSFIRKYSIDELPQFINVFVGQMSIVGPRPVVREETYTYMENVPLYMLRYQVRPGITGWAQINGYRGDPSLPAIEKRTEYDLYYIEHWSPWFDLKIFVRTIFGGFANSEKLK